MLVAIEEKSFNSDRLSRRSFRHLLTVGNSVTLIDEVNGRARGYVTLLFRANVSVARVYSIATAPDWLGQGVGLGLLHAAEELALALNCVVMRLEIRKDNPASQKLFLRNGYAVFGKHAAYYEDGMDALRLEKSLTARLRPELARTIYYRQTLGFTRGASCLMMAMKALDRDLVLDRTLELQIWRESTTIYMTAGHGGCGPYGLALDEVPPDLLAYAVAAANLIGDGLYGVDMKMTARGPVVIEVNDNPNIDAGNEDSVVLGDEMYRIVLHDLVRRLHRPWPRGRPDRVQHVNESMWLYPSRVSFLVWQCRDRTWIHLRECVSTAVQRRWIIFGYSLSERFFRALWSLHPSQIEPVSQPIRVRCGTCASKVNPRPKTPDARNAGPYGTPVLHAASGR